MHTGFDDIKEETAMNTTRFLWGFFLALTIMAPPAVFADVLGAFGEDYERGIRERFRAPSVEVKVADDGLELLFKFISSGKCTYILRGPAKGKNAGPVVDRGDISKEMAGLLEAWKTVHLPALKDGQEAKYHLDVIFHQRKIKITTNFGLKEMAEERKWHVVRDFIVYKQNGSSHVKILSERCRLIGEKKK